MGRGRGFLAHHNETENSFHDVSKLAQIPYFLNELKANQGIPISLKAIESCLLTEKNEATNIPNGGLNWDS